jgi:hydroxymethylbilane synthase
MGKIRIGTRESQLAIWQATQLKNMLAENGQESEFVFIKSEGDVDLVTPLYDIGVQGIFTRALDAALLSNKIDVAVHSMKDVPVQLAKRIKQAAVLKRGSYKDILVPHPHLSNVSAILGLITIAQTESNTKEIEQANHENTREGVDVIVATSSIRRIAQWSRRYPHHKIENLRGNVNTRLRKLKESKWQGAIFAAAGLERIGLRPDNAVELDWMLPAPAQGAIMVVCREDDEDAFKSCRIFNDEETALCTKIERDFLSALMGGCSTPISAFAEVKDGQVHFKGNILSPDGHQIAESSSIKPIKDAGDSGFIGAKNILANGGQAIIDKMKNVTK